MIRTVLIVIALAFTVSAQTSNVQTVKAWRRTHIMGVPGGTVLDPTGTIADGQRAAAAEAMVAESSNIVAAAAQGLTNALERLWVAASETNKFTGRLYLAADLDDDPDYENIESFRVREEYETNAIHYFVHYTRLLSTPPITVWAFETAPGVVAWAAGEVATNNVLTNVLGYACYDIRVERPAAAEGILLRTHKYLKWGSPSAPLDIPDAGLEIVSGGATNAPYTGPVCWTNGSNEITENYLSGFFYTVTTNEVMQ